MRVIVDGKEMFSEVGDVRTMGDLVELVKASVDPDSVITAMTLDGENLSDADWRTPLSLIPKQVFEISTGSREQYISERMLKAEGYAAQVIESFARTSDLYLSGEIESANRKMASAVDDLLAFVNWYMNLLSMDADEMKDFIAKFNESVEKVHVVCEEVLQQQLYQSWAVLGGTLRDRLLPELMVIRDLCRSARG